MFEKIKENLDKIFNEFSFSYVFLAVSLFGMWCSLHFKLNDIQVIAFIALKVSIYISVGATFVKFLNGVGCNINKKIFDEGNIAAAVLAGLFFVGLAIAVASGNLG